MCNVDFNPTTPPPPHPKYKNMILRESLSQLILYFLDLVVCIECHIKENFKWHGTRYIFKFIIFRMNHDINPFQMKRIILLFLNLLIAFVKSLSSSCVPYTSYMSSIIDVTQIVLVSILLAREYWGSKYIPKIQKYNSTTLSTAKDRFVATSIPLHHLNYNSNKNCLVKSCLMKVMIMKYIQ